MHCVYITDCQKFESPYWFFAPRNREAHGTQNLLPERALPGQIRLCFNFVQWACFLSCRWKTAKCRGAPQSKVHKDNDVRTHKTLEPHVEYCWSSSRLGWDYPSVLVFRRERKNLWISREVLRSSNACWLFSTRRCKSGKIRYCTIYYSILIHVQFFTFVLIGTLFHLNICTVYEIKQKTLKNNLLHRYLAIA